MIHNQTSLPRFFKGIALFTPGGDLIYGVDSSKQAHWHIHLCLSLQQILSLSEPPHFLVPGYTATVDRWLDAKTQQIVTSAEIYPAVKRYQSLLTVLFETEGVVWQTVPWQEEYCHPLILETYRHQFPQLWENHNLVIRLDPNFEEQPAKIFRPTATTYNARSLQYTSLKTNETEDITLESRSNISRSPITTYPASRDLPELNNNGYILSLFVSSDNVAIEKTLTKIYQLLEEGLVYPYTLKVIDISKHPEQAENYNIAATPTLLRVWPEPVRRIVGQLDDFERVLQIISSV
ncbi:MAG: circadian clock KaiB family protein [Xenococcaceae cyanobacterium]